MVLAFIFKCDLVVEGFSVVDLDDGVRLYFHLLVNSMINVNFFLWVANGQYSGFLMLNSHWRVCCCFTSECWSIIHLRVVLGRS